MNLWPWAVIAYWWRASPRWTRALVGFMTIQNIVIAGIDAWDERWDRVLTTVLLLLWTWLMIILIMIPHKVVQEQPALLDHPRINLLQWITALVGVPATILVFLRLTGLL